MGYGYECIYIEYVYKLLMLNSVIFCSKVSPLDFTVLEC